MIYVLTSLWFDEEEIKNHCFKRKEDAFNKMKEWCFEKYGENMNLYNKICEEMISSFEKYGGWIEPENEVEFNLNECELN